MKHLSLITLSISMALSGISLPVISSVNLDTASAESTNITNKEFQALRLKWAESFLGDPDIPFDDTLSKMVITNYNAAKKQWASMNKESSRLALWNDLTLDDQTQEGKKNLGANLRSSYQRLFIMAKAYKLRGSQLQNDTELLNSVIDGLRFLNNYYKVGAKEWGNWWHWELGTPKDINNILIVLYDVLPADLMASYIDATRYFTPLPTHLGAGAGADVSSNPRYRESTGGNRTDNTLVVLLRGVLDNNSQEITDAIKALSPVVETVENSDGFYKDGSFLQHYDIAYNGTYGNVLLGGLGAQINLVANTRWKITDPKIQQIYPLIFKSYAPLLYRGTMMEFVNGRAISRPQEQGHQVGHSVIASLIHYIDGASNDDKYRLQQLIKTQISQDTYLDFFKSINHVGNYQKARKLMSDGSVKPQDAFTGFFAFPAMDRVVYRHGDWAFSLAMHSSRTGNYECMNNENRKGWFTGDGMGYLYTRQLSHYQDYWPAVDNYRLEGTTVDDRVMNECQGQRNQIKGGRNTAMNWVGSVKLGDEGAAAMEFSNWDDTLSAKKSWFMFNHEVVLLGSDIQSQFGAEVTTTVANRKLPDSQAGKIQVNGQLWQGEPEVMATSLVIESADTDIPGLHYVFLEPTRLELQQETRSGNWSEIGTKAGEVTASFVTATIEQTPELDHYAYIIRPESAGQAVQNTPAEQPIKVIRMDASAHIIHNRDEKIFAANVWQDDPVEVTEQVSAMGKMALMIKNEDKAMAIAISDPLQNQTTLQLKFNKNIRIISDTDGRLQLGDNHILAIDVQGLKGQSYTFKVE
ncbi:polysaccharide lyase 8 family protein [Vibrio fluvialis]|uniref:polysaccharide lyase 8 family protein n=1 Tax=Vibrio fluvialis TaxID=676 RepID=UPI0005C88CD7|nr:polysaccharide lyase 8 family protein [Vibrio fluvialis]